MESTAHLQTNGGQKQLSWRIFWFIAGSGFSYLLISTPFHWLKLHTQFPTLAISACSYGVSTCIFFLWNYFVNFRTDIRKRDALPRYLTAVGIMWVLQSLTLWLLKQHDAHLHLNILEYQLDLDIVATQLLLAGVKFPLYHKWAFPLPREEAS